MVFGRRSTQTGTTTGKGKPGARAAAVAAFGRAPVQPVAAEAARPGATRHMAEAGRLAGANQAAPAPGPLPQIDDIDERLSAMRSWVYDLMVAAANLASTIAAADLIDERPFEQGAGRNAYPLPNDAVGELFSYPSSGGTRHPVYAYNYLDLPDQLDVSAQVHLSELIDGVTELNSICREAWEDGALSLAAQSKRVRDLVDQVIVAAAFFSALFENMRKLQPLFAADAGFEPGVAMLRQSYEHYRSLAREAMLAPERLDDLMPSRRWPLIGVEIAWKDHPGQRFINNVYFPVEQARPIMARLERMRAAADLVPT